MFSARTSAVVFKALVSTSFSINPISSSLVNPANSLSLGWQVTFLAMLKPEVNESKETEETPVINVFATTLSVKVLMHYKSLLKIHQTE